MNNKRNKFIFSVMLLVLSAFVLFSFVSAGTVTLTSPVSYSNNTGTLDFTCTAHFSNTTNASLVYNATGGTTDLDATFLTTIVNTTGDNQSAYSSTGVSVAALSDLATYNFTCIAGMINGSSAISPGTLSITVDNTAPTCTSSRSGAAKPKKFGSQELTCSCTDTVDSGISHSRVLFNPLGGTTNVSTTPGTVSGGDLSLKGTYTFACTALDYVGNNGTATNLTFNVEAGGSLASVEEAKERKLAGTATLIIIIAVIGIGLAGAWYYTQKPKARGKRRKRRRKRR